MKLALFDLDNTLLAGDSDHGWGNWLCEKGIVDKAYYKQKNDEFYQNYIAGTLNVTDYLNFTLTVLKEHSIAQLNEWHKAFMQEVIEPIILKKAEELLARHRRQGYRLVIVTATNRFVTAPIAKRLKVDDLIATECEIKNNKYTGEVINTPCFQEGKVIRVKSWLKQHNASIAGSYFYSDSINDLPLLSIVDNPVAVDPDDKLRAIAEKNHWSVISLRD